MHRTLEIVLLSIGDSTKVSTWSNVPFFFSEQLVKQGCQVHRVNIAPDRFLKYPYDALGRVFRRLGKNSEHNYFRSGINARITQWRIDRALSQYPCGLPIFMTFTFGAADHPRPYVLFCDRTLEHYIRYFHDRSPDPLEMKSIEAEKRNLDNAALIISLFPEMAETLATKYGDKVRYLGNVVNLSRDLGHSESLLKQKWNSRNLLFIGKGHYKVGLVRLLEALQLLNADLEEPYHLHVVGLRGKDVPECVHENVTFHGYLDKANAAQFDRYVHLLRDSFLFVNPNPKWASFSASCEAMFFSTPLIIQSYPEFVSTFGEGQTECWFLPSDRTEDLVHLIRTIAADREGWEMKASSALKAVKPFTWEAYTEKVLHAIDPLLKG